MKKVSGISTETVDSILRSLGTGTKKAKLMDAPYMPQFSNSYIENLAMPCPMCLVAKNHIEAFNVHEIRSFEHHLSISHGMGR
jgi:hypothetical protein